MTPVPVEVKKNLKSVVASKFLRTTICLLPLFLFAATLSATAPFDLTQVAQSPQWLRLMHYQKTWMGGYQSRIVAPTFFFSVEGKTNPLAELQALVNEAQTSTDHSWACRFPARADFLSTYLKVQRPTCPNLAEWERELSSEKIYLGLATQYLAHPASVMGHTYLRFHNPNIANYLQYTVNFSASIEENTPIYAYIYKGIFGGFEGIFYLVPYYVKLEEYSNIDLRDIWEYELKLSASEIKKLVWHLYELSHEASFQYFFATQNCASLLMDLLEVARPQLELRAGLPFFHIPVETVKVMDEQNLFSEVAYRPSLELLLNHKYEHLADQQKKSYRALVDKKIPVADIKDAQVLDVYMDYWDVVRSRASGVLKDQELQLWNETLLARSRNEESTVKMLEPPAPPAPHLGQKAGRLAVITGAAQFGPFVGADLRVAIHGLEDSDIGFQKNSEVDILRAQARYYQNSKLTFSKRLLIDDIKVLSVVHLMPITKNDKKISWNMLAELRGDKFHQRPRNYLGHVHLGAGAGLRPLSKLDVYALPTVHLEHGNFSQKNYLGLAADLGFIYNDLEKIKFKVSATPIWQLYPFTNREFRLQSTQDVFYFVSRQISVGLNFQEYFLQGQANWIEGALSLRLAH